MLLRPVQGQIDFGQAVAVDKLIDRQSSEADQEKRQRLVWEIERNLAEDGCAPDHLLRPPPAGSRERRG